MIKYFKTHILATGLGLVALCSLTSCANFGVGNNVDFKGPITVPQEFIYTSSTPKKSFEREQALVVNATLSMDSDKRSIDEKAELFYALGTVYDDLGLEGMARYMMMNAIVQRPGFARPYELLGIYFFQEGRVADACDALASAIELDDPENRSYFPYLNRAFIMYYTGRYNLALEDMREFYDDNPFDPYRLLSMYIVEREAIGEKQAHDNLKRNFDKLLSAHKEEQFGHDVVRFYLGKISEKDLMDKILQVRDDEAAFQDRLCEGYYYLGKKALFDGNDKLGYDYFSLCRNTRKYNFLEYRNALNEQKVLLKKYNLDELTEEDESQM